MVKSIQTGCVKPWFGISTAQEERKLTGGDIAWFTTSIDLPTIKVFHRRHCLRKVVKETLIMLSFHFDYREGRTGAYKP